MSQFDEKPTPGTGVGDDETPFDSPSNPSQLIDNDGIDSNTDSEVLLRNAELEGVDELYEETGLKVILPDQNAGSGFEPSPADVEKALVGLNKKPGPKPKREAQPSAKPDIELVVPTPPARKFKSDSVHRNQNTRILWAWTSGLPNWLKQKCLWYVYREWPVLINRDPSEAKRLKKYGYIAKTAVDGTSTINDDNDLLTRYGCGNYRLVLNVEGKGEIATGWVTNLGGGMFREHPPMDDRINDTAEVDWSNPQNASYERYLRSVGKHPDSKNVEEDDDMAQQQGQALTEMSKMVTGTVDKLVAITERVMDNNNQRGSIDSESIAKAMEIVADGAKKSNDVVMEAVTRAQTINAKSSEGGGAAFDALGKLLEATQKEMAEMRQHMNKMQIDQMQNLMDEVRSLRAASVAAPTPKGGVEGIKEMLTSFQEMRTIIRSEMELDGSGKEAVEEVAEELAPKWLRPFLPIAGVLGNVLMQKFMTPNVVPGQMPMQPPPQMQPQQQQLQPPNSGPFPQPQPGPQLVQNQPGQPPTQPNGQPVTPPALEAFIAMIAPGVLTSLKGGKTGDEFAEIYMDWLSEEAYEELFKLGLTAQSILQFMYNHPQLGPQLAQFPQERVVKFVTDFMEYGEKDGEVPGPEPVPPATNGGGAA